jgi:hypothetical protein
MEILFVLTFRFFVNKNKKALKLVVRGKSICLPGNKLSRLVEMLHCPHRNFVQNLQIGILNSNKDNFVFTELRETLLQGA